MTFVVTGVRYAVFSLTKVKTTIETFQTNFALSSQQLSMYRSNLKNYNTLIFYRTCTIL